MKYLFLLLTITVCFSQANANYTQLAETVCSAHFDQKKYSDCYGLIANADSINSDALDICVRLSSDSAHIKCIKAVVNSTFSKSAISVCNEMPDVSTALRCVRIVANTNLADHDLRFCLRQGEANFVNSCLIKAGGNKIGFGFWPF